MTKTDFSTRPGATSIAIDEAQGALRVTFPADYLDFMRKANGGEGFVAGHYLVLWPIEKLVQYNRDYLEGVDPDGFVLFGSNGAGEAFAFDTRTTPLSVVEIPFIGFSRNDALSCGGGFADFMLAPSAFDDRWRRP